MKKYILIGFLIGFGLSMAISPFFISKNIKEDAETDPQSKYPLLARRIFTQNPNDMIINFTDLRVKIHSYIGSSTDKIGFYFEYLPTGVHIGVNDRDPFFRASLVKLPVIMKAYKLIEEGKLSKDEVVPITRDEIDKGYGEFWKEGRSEIKLGEAIEIVLETSDNTAFRVVNNRVNKEIEESGNIVEKAIIEVYDYLDIPRDTSGQTQSITPRNFGSILKSLFFSAYLSYDNSSEILKLLGKSKFKDWLPKNIPGEITVSHKTGTFDSADGSRSVHADCGIVYYPNRPYLICIMVNSNDLDTSLKHINYLSSLVFNYVKSINGK